MGCWHFIVTFIRIHCLDSMTSFMDQSAKVSQSFKDELQRYSNSSLTILIIHYRVMPASDYCLQLSWMPRDCCRDSSYYFVVSSEAVTDDRFALQM